MRLVQHVSIEPDWPETGVTADGEVIRLADVESIIPPGNDRANVHYLRDGFKVYPWRDAGHYVDEDGNALTPCGPEPMSREHLASLGLNDGTLWSEHRAYYEKTPPMPEGADVPEAKALRAVVFAEVSAAWYGDMKRRHGDQG